MFYFPDCNDPDGALARERLCELWEIHSESYLSAWIAESPGTRPWAWWEFEAPEPRREVNPPARWFHLVDEGEDGRRRMGRILIGNASGDDLVDWLEPEHEYLARLDLLEPGEAERIPDELDAPGAVVNFDVDGAGALADEDD